MYRVCRTENFLYHKIVTICPQRFMPALVINDEFCSMMSRLYSNICSQSTTTTLHRSGYILYVKYIFLILSVNFAVTQRQFYDDYSMDAVSKSTGKRIICMHMADK